MKNKLIMGMTYDHQMVVVNALREELEKGIPFEPSPLYPAQVNERIETAGEAIVENASLTDQERERVSKALNQVKQAKGKAAKFMRLMDASDVFAKVFYPRSACSKSKCNHCCYTPVTLMQVEAEFIGKAIKVQPAKITAIHETPAASYSNPCTFLDGNGRCSIYAHRPLICRTHHNMDKDDLLCQLVDGVSIPVPYADVRMFVQLEADIMEMGVLEIADIREWFPTGIKK